MTAPPIATKRLSVGAWKKLFCFTVQSGTTLRTERISEIDPDRNFDPVTVHGRGRLQLFAVEHPTESI